MRYIQPRKAIPSKEKGYSDRPTPPPRLSHSVARFVYDNKGKYLGNTPFVKPIHRKMKTYSGDMEKT
jgi:hypothetical protein